MDAYRIAAMEQMVKIQEVILRAVAKSITCVAKAVDSPGPSEFGFLVQPPTQRESETVHSYCKVARSTGRGVEI